MSTPRELLCGRLVCAVDGHPSARRPWPFIWEDQPSANARVLRERAAGRAHRNAMGKEYSSDATGDGPADSAIVERDAGIDDTPFLVSTDLLGVQERVYASTPGLYEVELSAVVQTSGDAAQTAH